MFKITIKFVFILLAISLYSNMAFAVDKKIGVLIFDGVLTSDVTAPLEVFGAANKKPWFTDYKVITIAVDNVKMITTEEGLVLQADSWIGEDIKLDALVVPSRYTMSPLLENEQLITFIKQIDETAQFMMSNCSGSSLLAQSGVLDGKRATTWAGGEAGFQKDFPKVNVINDSNVVVDGKYISSNGSLVSYEAALVALTKMSSESNSKEIFDALQMSRVTSWDRIAAFL